MFSTPFCAHSFTEGQLSSLEWVVCPCGYHYRSDLLREYAARSLKFVKAKEAVESLVQDIAYASSEHKNAMQSASYYSAPAASGTVSVPVPAQLEQEVQPYVPRVKEVAPPRPKRERATISISQWLIITASVLVLIAASVFVQGNRANIGPGGWFAIEGVLALGAGAGAIYGRKMSVMLANFLAVFSAGMLMSIIMTLGTQLNLGFSEFDQEPSWYWGINLALVSAATMVAAKFTKNFGWRALAPISLTIAGLLLTYGALGDALSGQPSAFGWQLIAISATAIALLAQLKFLRAIKLEVSETSENKEYEEDLHKREDSALQQFGRFATIGLAVVATGYTLVQILGNVLRPFDAFATLALGAFWLLGSVTIDSWGSSLSKSGEVSDRIKTTTWTFAYVSIGLGLNAIATQTDLVGLNIAISLIAALALSTLPHFARFVKPPRVTMLATSWSILGTWVLWNITAHWKVSPAEFVLEVAIYLFGFTIVSLASAWITKSHSNAPVGLTLSAAGSVLLATSIFGNVNSASYSPWFNGLFLLLVVACANLMNIAEPLLANRSGDEPRGYVRMASLAIAGVSALTFVIEVGANSEITQATKGGTLSLIIALAAWVVGAQLVGGKAREFADAQSLIAFTLAILSATFVSALKDDYVGFELAVFAIIAYLFAYLQRSAVKFQIGLGTLILSLYVISVKSFGTGTKSFETFFIILLGVTAVVGLHSWLVAKRTEMSARSNATTSLVIASTNVFLTGFFGFELFQRSPEVLWYYIALGTLSLIATEFSKNETLTNSLRRFGLIVLAILFSTAGTHSVIGSWFSHEEYFGLYRTLMVTAGFVAAAGATRALFTTRRLGWSIGTYLGTTGIALVVGSFLSSTVSSEWRLLELTTIPIGLALALSSYAIDRVSGKVTLWRTADLPVSFVLLPSLLGSFTAGVGEPNLVRILVVGLILAVYGYFRALQAKQVAWTAAGLLGGLFAIYGLLSDLALNHRVEFVQPETASLSIAALVVVNGMFVNKLIGKKLLWLITDVPVAVAVLPSLFYSAAQSGQDNTLRLVLIGAIVALYGYFRAFSTKIAYWTIAGLGGAVLMASELINQLYSTNNWTLSGPEVYSLTFAALFLANGWILNRIRDAKVFWLVGDVPLAIALIPSAIYALLDLIKEANNASLARLLVVGVVAGGYGYWRTLRDKNPLWTIAVFGGFGLVGTTIIQEFALNSTLHYEGVEPFSVAILVSEIAGLRLLKKLDAVKGTLITWGLPLATVILPSTFNSYDALTSHFADLNLLQVTRVILVILVSAAALILGTRAGNLGAASAGTAGLTLSVVPNLWNRVDGVAGGQAQVELRALIIGGLLFTIMAVAKRFEAIRGNSLVFVGIPTMVALAPSAFGTLAALTTHANSYQVIDWWRFALVLSVSLILLVVGSMRELAGMFYPGFAGVLVAALPYGFRTVDGAAWLLWVILLLVAATLIWLAIRLEKMRKEGRTPAMWLKELK